MRPSIRVGRYRGASGSPVGRHRKPRNAGLLHILIASFYNTQIECVLLNTDRMRHSIHRLNASFYMRGAGPCGVGMPGWSSQGVLDRSSGMPRSAIRRSRSAIILQEYVLLLLRECVLILIIASFYYFAWAGTVRCRDSRLVVPGRFGSVFGNAAQRHSPFQERRMVQGGRGG